LTLFN